jgi:hypothetical protein
MENTNQKNKRQDAWDEWNKSNPAPVLTTEQTIEWLEGMRELMFEIWKNNPPTLDRLILADQPAPKTKPLVHPEDDVR